jgi:Amino-transferase class IV
LALGSWRGFDNCLMRDLLGNIAELGTANVFMAKDEIVCTPAANGTFLNGITRQRVIDLLRVDGMPVIEKTLSYADFAPTRSSRPGISPRWRRSFASTTARSHRAGSTSARASSTGPTRTGDRTFRHCVIAVTARVAACTYVA